ncbi:Imm74 family immunity protein [Halopseudomonas yangmingensis]|uniref:Imm74 family immunity protein n=1 Tax=Halopseudomonas yangmingensis TaxID=1720063 RepID=UPI000B883B20|nr:Imm74 family immunity protein [Halopseudomonas yangmingensis]
MILEVSRGYIKVSLRGRLIKVPGEMFFPENGKIGFAISKREIKFWDAQKNQALLSSEDIKEVIEDISQDFNKGGHILEVDE